MSKNDERTLTNQLNRREVLKRGFLLSSALLLSGNIMKTSGLTPKASPKTGMGTMHFRGVNYDTGTNHDASYTPASRTVWQRDLLERDMRAIREGLHCNAVCIYGTDIARLVEASTVALSHGLEVWLQPRLMGASERDRLEHLAEVAQKAETLRQRGSVTLNVGVELSIFMAGIIPGETLGEKAEALGKTWQSDLPTYTEKLNRHLEVAASLARSTFSGPLTYSAGEWENVRWDAFDIIGRTFYEDADNSRHYVQTLRDFRLRHGINPSSLPSSAAAPLAARAT